MFKFNFGDLILPVQMLVKNVFRRGLKAVGRHVIVEAFGCDRRILDDLAFLKKTLLEAARRAKMQVCGEVFHEFNPQGVTGVVVVKESHIAIHTWPEYGYASVDIFTCGGADPWRAYDHIVGVLKPGSVQVIELKRGFVGVGG